MTTPTTSVIDLAKALMACASITPNDAGCQKIIKKHLATAGFHCESMPFGEVENLWAKVGSEGPLVLFVGHTDVVPTGNPQDWTSPPFTPEVRDGMLYGRGATDMKGAIAAMVVAVEAFRKKHPEHPGSIGFILTSDEEGPATHGTRMVVEQLLARGEKIDYCIIGEPSSDKKIGDQIRVGRRGSLHGKVTIHGIQGHVAHPHLAKNPIHASMQVFHDLAHTEWDHGTKDFPPTSFQITNIHSGTGATNVIPGHLEAQFNFRFSTAVGIDKIKERTEHQFKKHGHQFDIEWSIGAEPFLTNHGKLVEATQLAIRDVAAQSVKLSTGGGTSDGRFIAPTGAELIELGTIHATAHHVDEHIAISDLEKLAAMYEKILENLLG